MKDYLNTDERNQVISSILLRANLELLSKSNFLNKTEKADIKRAMTYINKTTESIKGRLNPKAKEVLEKDKLRSRVFLDNVRAMEELMKKRESDYNKTYEENRDYYYLVELILHYTCNKCQKKCTECEIYSEFEDKCIPEITGFNDYGHCKYAYDRDLSKGDK
ncbi:DUF5651 domain-containing protein [Clostridium cellulovorans]|uniref:DUF5651 domain-containing protein n=1 Tax=Clostridium cellulovorans (strain ATCC 35296 / DSM 3052 / OCM 3 / 743B) TaxID=573061 RepID=D9SWF3_CLOC7|nr:DUF5651 domain-containing protein [Clostridium cellulovorans]ADL53235.1 hypothetical protein Clocel_3559 [Clostridium cellulovorans 743B]